MTLARRAVAAVIGLGLATAAFAQAPATTPKAVFSARPARFAFAFDNADISLVAEEVLSRSLGVSYAIDPGVAAKISFRLDRRLTPIQLLEAFEAALEQSDIVLVRQGDSFILRSRAKAKAAAGFSAQESSSAGRGVGFETATVNFAYAKPSEVAKTLQAMSGADPVVFADDRQGTLVLSGSGQSLDTLVQLAKSFDRSGLEASKIRFFELTTAPAETVATELAKVLSGAEFSGASVVPLKRLNGLLVFGRTTQALDQVALWILRLDVPSKETASSLFVYHPKNVTADALGSTLTSVLGDGASTAVSSSSKGSSGASTSGAKASVVQPSGDSATSGARLDDDTTRVGIDKESNTLLLFTTASRWVQIQRVLSEIDRPVRQVMIEASILEVTLTDRTSLGVDFSLIDSHGKLSVSSINSAAGFVASQAPGFAIAYLGSDIKVAINALGEQGHVEVVSAPKVLALDNHPARLDVGDQVPIVTQTGQSTIGSNSPIINSVEYRPTGVILKVTPRISGDNSVTLDVEQEVSSVSQTTTSAINSPTIQQRKIATSLVLENGGLVALGGLISTGRSTSDTGFPYLKDIPVLGSLFKTNRVSHNRTELIILLTARIAGDAKAAQRITQEVVLEMKELERRGLLH